MIHLVVLCIVGLAPYLSETCNPQDASHWTQHEKEMVKCLTSQNSPYLKHHTEQEGNLVEYYKRVFDPKTRSGRATLRDQELVRGCITTQDFLYYGVIPDVPSTTTTTTSTPSPTTTTTATNTPNPTTTTTTTNTPSPTTTTTTTNTPNPTTTSYPTTSTSTTTSTPTTSTTSTTTTTTAAPPTLDNFADVRPLQRQILLCLRTQGASDISIREWYNRTLNSATRTGHVSSVDQLLARQCIEREDYGCFGVTLEGYTTTTQASAERPTTPSITTTPATFLGATAREQKLMDCLIDKGWSSRRLAEWYSRVLSPETRSGRATLFDQDLVRGCISLDDFLYYGVTPDGYELPATGNMLLLDGCLC